MIKELSNVILKLYDVIMEPLNVKKNKGTTKCEKRTIKCDIGTAQYEDRTVNCGKKE